MLALVDDWGNPSPGKTATEWFGFAAVLLQDSQVETMRSFIKSVCRILGRASTVPLHFRELSCNSKYHITQLFAKKNPAISIVAARIHAVTSPHLTQRGWAYRYYGKEMVRVATHFAADLGEDARVVFHRHAYLKDFGDYIFNKLRNNSWYLKKHQSNQILYDRLKSLSVADDEEEHLLGLADCVANGCHSAMNPDSRWQQANPSCLNLLTECIWKGPSYHVNARSFGAILEPGGIPLNMMPDLPTAIRRHWE